jgi:hypothetical protein
MGWERSICEAFNAAERAVSRGVVEAMAAQALVIFLIGGVGAATHIVFKHFGSVSPSVPCFLVGSELCHVNKPDYGLGSLVHGFDGGEVDGGGEGLESPVLRDVGHTYPMSAE